MTQTDVFSRPMTAKNREEAGGFPLSVPGTYEFTVNNVVPDVYPGGAKMGRCAHLSVELSVDGKDEAGRDLEVKVFENLYNDPKAEWRMLDFAKSVGLYYDGITAGEIAKKSPRHIGKAEIIIEEYNGTKRNKVKRWIEAEPEELPF